MPRHSYRKSISKPFLPLARALSLPKQDRGISNTSVRATIIREALAAYENGDISDKTLATQVQSESSRAQPPSSCPLPSSDASTSSQQDKPDNAKVKPIAPLSPENWPLVIAPAQKPDEQGDAIIDQVTAIQNPPLSSPPNLAGVGLSAIPEPRIPASRRIPSAPPSSFSSTSYSLDAHHAAGADIQAAFLPGHQRRSKSVSLLPSKSAKLDVIAEGVDDIACSFTHEEFASSRKNMDRKVHPSSHHIRFRSASVGNLTKPLSKIDEEGNIHQDPGADCEARPPDAGDDDDDDAWQLLTLKLRKGAPAEPGQPSRTRSRLRSAFRPQHLSEHLSLSSLLHHPPHTDGRRNQRKKSSRRRYSSANDAAVEVLASTSPVIPPLLRSPTAADVWSSQLQTAIEHAGNLSTFSMGDEIDSGETTIQPKTSTRMENGLCDPVIALHSRAMSSCPELSVSSTPPIHEDGSHSADTTLASLDIDFIDYHSRYRTSSTDHSRSRHTSSSPTPEPNPSSSASEEPSEAVLSPVGEAQELRQRAGPLPAKRQVTFATYSYDTQAKDTREPLMLRPRDLNQDLHVKPWLITLPQRMLAERRIGVRDWDRDRLESWYKQEEGPCVRIGRSLTVKCKEGCPEPNCGDCRERCIASTLVV